MTILQINKFYYPRGGAEVVMLETQKLLEAHKHLVVPFAMRHPKNLETPYSHAFVSFVETEKVSYGWQGLRTAGRMLYSFEAQRKLGTLVQTTKPEVAHIHNIYHQLSPSIFAPLRKAGVRTVMSVHDWALLSSNYMLFGDGLTDSGLANWWAGLVFSLHRFFGLYKKSIDCFIAPSSFVKKKLVKAGFSEDKITIIPHFIDVKKITPSPTTGDYVGYLGRLVPEKGVSVLLDAAKSLPEIPFKIAGTGPEEEKLKARVKEEGIGNVEFVGRLDGVLRDRFYRNALCLVVPSVWQEVFGRVVLEAYAAGKPVIASRIGSLPELVRDGETGFLFKAGKAEDLAGKIKEIVAVPEKRCQLGETSRRIAEIEYNPELHYDRLVKVYQSAKS